MQVMIDKPRSDKPRSIEAPVEVSSFTDKTEHKWIDAEPDQRQRSEHMGSSVRTPNELHNEFGPGSEPRPDPALVPSLFSLALILGIELLPSEIAGERLIEGRADSLDSEYEAPLEELGAWYDGD